MTNNEFISYIKPLCIADHKKTGILASMTGAQAIIESNWGRSGLSVKGNNLFGMKGSYQGQSVTMRTKEFVNGSYITINAKFRKYPSFKESIEDHGKLLSGAARYKNLVNCKDYRTACRLLQKDGYATSPTYADTLIKTIEKYFLYLWDDADIKVNPYREPMTNLKQGSKGVCVKWLQYELRLNGYDVAVDGIFGPLTDAAVCHFQFKAGLITDGIVGPKTRSKLKGE